MKLKKIRNAFLFVLTLALVSAAAVAITYALGTSMGNAQNTFTSEPNIDVEISEVDFDNSTGYGETTHTAPYELGQDKAQKYYPTATIPKNPKLTNTSDEPANGETNDEWVAMTVEYKVKINSTWYTYPGYTEFKSALASVYTSAELEFNTTDWKAHDGKNTIFYYKKEKLQRNHNTTSLFNSVKIKETFTTTNVNNKDKYVITYYNNGTAATENLDSLPEFQIDLKGYAVSAKSIATASAAETPLYNLIQGSTTTTAANP